MAKQDSHAHAHSHADIHGKVKSTVAKSEDGTLQIIFTIDYGLIEETRNEVIEEYAKDIEVPGFRKGNAPKAKVLEKIPQDSLIQHTLSHILPHALGDAIDEHKIKPAIYPKFELIKAKDGEAWEIKATTCELPEVTLGDYRKNIQGEARSSKLWTPGKGDPKDESHSAKATRDQKEQVVIKGVLDSTKVVIPKILIEEEVNVRLSNLLERIEKLGLNLDSYLGSIGKTPESLRVEYEQQSETTLKLDLALGKIIQDEKVKVEDKAVEDAVKASQADPSMVKPDQIEEQKRVVRRILEKRAILDSLVALL